MHRPSNPPILILPNVTFQKYHDEDRPLPYEATPATANVRAMELFRDELGKLSGGQFKVEVYPSGQLGSFREAMEAVQLGTQQSRSRRPQSPPPLPARWM